MIKEILSQYIQVPPDVIQFAMDRKYEEAWIISRTSSKPTKVEVDAYCANPHTLLIVEYIWNEADDANRFVLTFFMDKKCMLQNPIQFVNINLELFYARPTFQDVIRTLDEKVVGHSYLLTTKPELVAMSVFNHWLSVGPVELWRFGKSINDAEITSTILARPEIEKSKLNYQGLLFRFNVSGRDDGPSYGIKTPCCRKVGSEWIVDLPLTLNWVHKLTA